MKIGVIGCGNMGGGMIGQLVAAGMDISCYDPDSDIYRSRRYRARYLDFDANNVSSDGQIGPYQWL